MKLKKYIYLVLSLSLFSLSALADPSVELLEKAERGDLEAQLAVAEVYRRDRNYEKYIYWYEKAAQQGSIEAKYRLYWHYHFNYDSSKQLEWLYSLMDDPKLSINDIEYRNAIVLIASTYFGDIDLGGTIEKNKKRFKQVIEALNKIANSHYSNAQIYFYLAKLYYYGLGEPKNPRLAYKWAVKTLSSKVDDSYDYLEKYESRRNINLLANLQRSEARKMIALLEYQGLEGEKNREAAIKKWEIYVKTLSSFITNLRMGMKKLYFHILPM